MDYHQEKSIFILSIRPMMTNETDSEITNSESTDCTTQHQSSANVTNSFPNDEHRRKVSMSQSTIQADNEKQKRKNSNLSSKSIHSNSDNTSSNCYVNPTFQSCSTGEIPVDKRTSITSQTTKLSNYLETAAKKEISNEPSWWYVFCMKCRRKEAGPGWEPDYWQKLCPHPFCPSYRQVARLLSLFIIGSLIWGIVYFIAEKEAAPGGQLFNIALVCLTAHFCGWIFQLANLPALLGMIITGIVFQNVGLISISPEYAKVTSILRKISLVVLLTRAGLDLDPVALKKLYLRVITLGLVPWLIEAIAMAILSHYFLDFPWMWAMLLGCIIGAVAPAVVVPCLFRLRNKGYGVVKGIPTLIIAVAGINDALSVAFFGLFHSIMFAHHSLVFDLLIGPVSLACGLGFGVVWGFLARYIPERQDPFVVPLRVLMLFFGGLVAVFGSEFYGFEGAGPLGVISAAFVSISFWSKQGWNIEDNPVVTAFEVFWIICQPVLFSLTGAQIVLSDLNMNSVLLGGSFVFICLTIRIIGTILIASGSSLNLKEKLFVSLSWMAKASVQAVLAPAAVESVRKSEKTDQLEYALNLVTICVMAMLITVPIGAISISSLGTRLLTKTKHVVPAEGWRRSARPSLRDITIIDEEIENYDTDAEFEKNNGKLPSASDTEDLNDVTTPVFTHVN